MNQISTKTKKKYKICRTCVMDVSDSAIVFDRNGVCDHCRNFKNKTLSVWDPGSIEETKLLKLADQIRRDGQRKDFDCIIGMSGGIDSSYLVYLAKVKLGLRPLVYHVDCGWNSQMAANNIEQLINRLGLDLVTEVINWTEMRDLQLAFFKSGVSHLDTPQDHAIFAMMYKFASQHKVKYILTGGNLSTECIRNPVEWMYYQSDSVQLLDIHRKFGEIELKTYPTTSILWHKIWLPYFRGIKVIRPLNLITFIKDDAKTLLQERFGWQPYPQKHFESRFTRFYESYWLPKRFGYDVRRVQYSSLILTKQMTRDEALRLLEIPSYDKSTIDREIDFISNKLNITAADLNQYMALPNKGYKDYKNSSLLYGFGARIMKLLQMEVGGKR